MKSLSFALILLCCASSLFAFHSVGGKGSKKGATKAKTSYTMSSFGTAVGLSNRSFNTPVFTGGVNIGFRRPITPASRVSVGANFGYAKRMGQYSFSSAQANTAYNIPLTKNISIAPVVSGGFMFINNYNSPTSAYTLFTKPGITTTDFGISPATTWMPDFSNPRLFTSLGLEPSINIYRANGMRSQVFMRYDFGLIRESNGVKNSTTINLLQLGLRILAD